jgi:hypothetical protein
MPSQTLLLKADLAWIDASQGKIFFKKFLAQHAINDKNTASTAVLCLHGFLQHEKSLINQNL